MSTEPTPTPPDLSAVPLIQIEDELQRRGFGFLLSHPKGTREAGVPTDEIIRELFRRKRAGECLALVITPSDLSEYWESDESGATHPGSRVPSEDAWRKMRKTFEVWQDVGAYSELMSCLRETWIQADPESFQDDKEETK
jgi:hypothetical protein